MASSLWDWEDPFMTSSAWESPLFRLRTAMDRIFEDFGSEFPALGAGFVGTFPRMNVRETADRYTLEAEVPGLRLEDVEITCSGRDLSLRGERKDSGESPESYVRRERPTGAFVRTISLPAEVDQDKVTATLEDGILEITVPKSKGALPRRIEVKSGGAQRIEGPEAQKPEAAEAKK